MRHYLYASFFLLITSVVSYANTDAQFPSCVHSASDQDGDGFGFENSGSCIVDETTSNAVEPGPCIDDNADGFGWNGVESCSVEIVLNPECQDTSPIGDGWGWNGIESCRVVSEADNVVSELELLKDKLVDVARDEKNSAFYCPSTDETVYLLISGFVMYFIGQDQIAEGMWTTGLYDRDNRMIVKLFGFNPRNLYLEEQGLKFGTTECSWFAD